MLKRVTVSPNQIQRELGQEVGGQVDGYANKDGTVLLFDPNYPNLFGLTIKGKLMTPSQKDKFSWDDEVVQRIVDTYPVQVQDRLHELHPTSAVVYHAIGQVTKERRAAGREATASPTLREITSYIEREFGVGMQFANVHQNHLPNLLEAGLVRRETAPGGATAPRGVVRVDPNELKEYDLPPPSTRGRPQQKEGSVWDDLVTPTAFEVKKDGSLGQ